MHVLAKYSFSGILCAAISLLAAPDSLAQSVDAGKTTTSPAKYDVKVPGGLSFSEFKGYESWEAVALSQNPHHVAVIVGNPVLIAAYKAGIPANGKPFPDGAKFAKIHWTPKKSATSPGQPTVPDTLHDVDFMVKDSKRFADSGGWGYAAFNYNAASNSFTPFTQADSPPQGNDAKCGFACHTVAKARDFVFTEYAKR
jgi:hypothetical protein